MTMRVVFAALVLAWVPACTSPCDLVLGCSDSPRAAVEGRVLASGNGHAISGAAVRLLAQYGASVDSTDTASDSRGNFSLTIPARAAGAPTIALRVMPPDRPGYLVELDECKTVVQWGDACVIDPLVNEPTLPIFLLLDANSNPVTNAPVSFKRTGGATMLTRVGDANVAVDSLGNATGESGFTNLFPVEIWTGSNEPVLGDLIVDLPPPVGRVVRHDYAVFPSVYYGLRVVKTETIGPAGGVKR